MNEWHDIIRRHSQPLLPRPTDQIPSTTALPGIAAVMFDVYGTLLVSASGDVGSSADGDTESAFESALQALSICIDDQSIALDNPLVETIHKMHAIAKEAGNEYPEVDIRQVWQETIQRLQGSAYVDRQQQNWEQLAIEYEVRANPVWPMPGMVSCLEGLRKRGLLLGLISNAQFFTPPLFPALTEQSLDELGIDPRLRFYSFEHSTAKPGKRLYEMAVDALDERGIQPESTLYVGNDVRNDIWPAQELGFRTALFAGDARSLRLRKDDSRVAAVHPDLIVTSLDQIPACLAMKD